MTRRYQRELSVLGAWLVMLGILAAKSPNFFAGDQVRSILISAAPVLVAAIGTKRRPSWGSS